jgi:hypothetical protein
MASQFEFKESDFTLDEAKLVPACGECLGRSDSRSPKALANAPSCEKCFGLIKTALRKTWGRNAEFLKLLSVIPEKVEEILKMIREHRPNPVDEGIDKALRDITRGMTENFVRRDKAIGARIRRAVEGFVKNIRFEGEA